MIRSFQLQFAVDRRRDTPACVGVSYANENNEKTLVSRRRFSPRRGSQYH